MNNITMHIKKFDPEPAGESFQTSDFLVRLRQQKLMINKLLRWCSFGVIASFIMIVISAIPFVNKLSLKAGWVVYLLPVLLILLLVALILLEYRYSEKRVRNSFSGEQDSKLYPFPIRYDVTSKKRPIIIYLTGISVIWIFTGFTSFATGYIASISLFIAGLFFYLLGLYLFKILLKKKCGIRQLLYKSGVHLSLL